MESQKPKIAMYVKRPFGEKLNASFDFIKENWKQLFKYSTYLILPICLIQAANFSGLMGSMTDLSATFICIELCGSDFLLMLGRFAADFPDLCDGAIVQ